MNTNNVVHLNYSAIKNNGFMKFLDKWMELKNIILSELIQTDKNIHGIHSLVSGYKLQAQDF